MNKKKLLMFGLPILAMALVAAAYLVVTLNADIIVNEAFVVSRTDASFNLETGETACSLVTIQNIANVPITAQLTFVEINNTSFVVYTTSVVLDEIAAGATESPEVCVTVAEDSSPGWVDGTITVERVAIP